MIISGEDQEKTKDEDSGEDDEPNIVEIGKLMENEKKKKEKRRM